MGQQNNANVSLFHHVLNRARWSSLAVARCVLHLLIEAFVAAGVTVDIVIDETLERGWGRKIRKPGHYRDSLLSSKERSVSNSGLRWITMALVVKLPWTNLRWALPFFSVLATTPAVSQALGQPHKTIAPFTRAYGDSSAKLPARGFDQGDWRERLQRDCTGLDLYQTAGQLDCAFALRCPVGCSTSCTQAPSAGTSTYCWETASQFEHRVEQPENAMGNGDPDMVGGQSTHPPGHDWHRPVVFYRHRAAAHSLGADARPRGQARTEGVLFDQSGAMRGRDCGRLRQGLAH